MKSILPVLASLIIISSVSCSKVNNRNMTVIKDCTGSYLRFNNKDYHICNIESVANIESGTDVKASFEKIDDCSNGEVIVCEMLHQNEGWITVTKIE